MANIRQVWSKAAPQRQVLIVLDVSGSMLGRTDKGIKLALAQNGVRTALAALPETARVAFWVFSNHIGAQGDDFKSLAAFAPMSDAGQRASLERGIAGLDKVVGGVSVGSTTRSTTPTRTPARPTSPDGRTLWC